MKSLVSFTYLSSCHSTHFFMCAIKQWKSLGFFSRNVLVSSSLLTNIFLDFTIQVDSYVFQYIEYILQLSDPLTVLNNFNLNFGL